MLVRNINKIINNLYINLYFDDDTTKEFTLEPNQEVKIKFNDEGFMKEISGIITNINNNTIVIDGSTKYESKVAHIKFDKILDCDYIKNPIVILDDEDNLSNKEDSDNIIDG